MSERGDDTLRTLEVSCAHLPILKVHPNVLRKQTTNQLTSHPTIQRDNLNPSDTEREGTRERERERKREREKKKQEKEEREKEKRRKREKKKKRKMPFAAAAPGPVWVALQSPPCTTWAPYAVSPKDWHAAVAQASRVPQQGRALREAEGGSTPLLGRRRSARSRSRSTRSYHWSSDAQRDGAELLEVVGGRPLAEAAANCVRSPPLPPWPPPTVVALQDLT